MADICGFTQMSDVMDPLAVMDMLHSLYSAYDSLSEVLPGVYKVRILEPSACLCGIERMLNDLDPCAGRADRVLQHTTCQTNT